MDCADNDYLAYICSVQEQASLIGKTPLGQALFLVVAAVGCIFTLWKAVIFIFDRNDKRRMARRLLELEKDTLISAFQNEDILEAQKDYIVPYCSNIDPSNQDDLRVTVGVRELVFSALWNEITCTTGQRYILILADSGMGKTTLLLNIFAREQKKRPRNRRRIALIPLNRNDAKEQIRKITNQRETILLLDAFDEDISAIEDYRKRMDELMTAAANFKVIIMTCRTQFFSQESTIPRETGIVKVAARRAGTPGVHEWRTVYLQPFGNPPRK
jgi:hypothetical protein